jgi:hypothetical protein
MADSPAPRAGIEELEEHAAINIYTPCIVD